MSGLPAKVTAGEPVVCAKGHEVARVLETLTLAQSITADAFSMDRDAIVETAPGRMTCAACGSPVAKALRGIRWSVRLSRGWVS